MSVRELRLPDEYASGSEELTVGAVAVSADSLVVGTAGGYMRYTYPDLQLCESREDFFEERCNGIQQSPQGLALLGNDRAASLESPGDWKTALLRVPHAGPVHRLDLGPGNWCMVKGLRGDTAVLYDVSEQQGIVGVDLQGVSTRWRTHGHVSRAWPLDDHRVLGLGDTALILDLRSGQVLAEHDLPLCESVRWTTATGQGKNLLLGGHSLPGRDYVLADWCPREDQVLRTSTIPPDRFFTSEQIQGALEDGDSCGSDVFDVAGIRVLADTARAVVAFGGDGEHQGTCRSLSAVALLDTRDLSILGHVVVDTEDGASALLVAPDGGIVVNCYSSVYVVRLRPER